MTETALHWQASWRADPLARELADRHYNRQAIGAAQFVPPGRCVVLRTPDAGAVWVTSWPFAEYVQHDWAGAWINSLFRRESGPLASELILDAVAVTRWYWPVVPELGLVTFVDATKIARKRDPGRCYRKAGFTLVGETGKGLLAWQLLEAEMPEARAPLGSQLDLLSAR